MNAKEWFVQKVCEKVSQGSGKETFSVLDLGSGTSQAFLPALSRYPGLRYVGVEPSKDACHIATKLLKPFPNAAVYHSGGYTLPEVIEEGSFDIVLSLSVLEHVKQLPQFLETSTRYASSGGLIVHRWDLGHAITPSSFKERFQVFVGNHFPRVLPEHKFVRYVGEEEVVRFFSELENTEVLQVTRHQMPSHKAFEKKALQTRDMPDILQELYVWEYAVSPQISEIPISDRDSLFPTIAVWVKKQN